MPSRKKQFFYPGQTSWPVIGLVQPEGVGGYTFVNAEAAALAARFTTPPTNARKLLIDNLVGSLKSAGIWTKLDCLWVMAAADSQAARQNWIADQYNLTAFNAPSFSADRGYTGNGSTSRLGTSYTPSVNAVQFTQNNGSLWLWSRTAGQGTPPDMGSIATSPQTRISTRNTGDVMAIRVSDGVTATAANTDGSGFFGAQRANSANSQFWRNGANIGTGVVTSTGLSTDEQWLLGANSGNFSVKEESVGAYGASLAGLESAFYTAILTYMQAVGAA